MFLSDFGTADEFVGVVHAVLHSHAPASARIDLTHDIAPHDVRAGALTLWRAVTWLAPAVILAVVDPGVGTERRAVALDVAPAGVTMVGPDNGLLLPAAHRLGAVTAAVELAPVPSVPGTFHGRDVFAPAAGRAAAGAPITDLGGPVDPAGLAGTPVAAPVVDATGGIDAEVLWVDRFGNAQLGVTAEQAGPGPFRLVTAGANPPGRPLRVVSSYGGIGADPYALVVDSYGHLSVCCDRAPAAGRLGLRAGDLVRLVPSEPRR